MVETSSRAHSDSTSSLDIWNAFYFHIKDGMKASETAVKICLHQKPFSAPRWKDKLSKLSEFAWRETKSGCFHLQTSSIWPLPSRLWKQFYCRSARDRREGWMIRRCWIGQILLHSPVLSIQPIQPEPNLTGRLHCDCNVTFAANVD